MSTYSKGICFIGAKSIINQSNEPIIYLMQTNYRELIYKIVLYKQIFLYFDGKYLELIIYWYYYIITNYQSLIDCLCLFDPPPPVLCKLGWVSGCIHYLFALQIQIEYF